MLFRIFFTAFLIATTQIMAQEPVLVTGSAETQIASSESREQAERRVEDLATIDALEKAFGKAIIQGNSTYIQNTNTGQKVETKSSFSMIANTYVKGEVLEVVDKKITAVLPETPSKSSGKKKKKQKGSESQLVGYITLKCTITIKAKEVTTTKAGYELKTLSCKNPGCERTQFKNGSDLFVYFKSPVEGYLSIYFDDQVNAFRLLPYSRSAPSEQNGFYVEPDKEYILFSTDPEHNYSSNKHFLEDPLQVQTEKDQELDRIFVIFSRKPLDKPALGSNAKLSDYISDADYNAGYRLPSSLKSEDFQRWLMGQRIANKDIETEVIDITINSK